MNPEASFQMLEKINKYANYEFNLFQIINKNV